MNARAPTRASAHPRNASTSLDPPDSRPPASSSTSTSIRRNLFPSTTSTAARRQLRHQHDHGTSSSSGSTLPASATANNDIIERDPITGGFKIDAPQVPGREVTLEDEEEEARRRMIESWRKMGDAMVDHNEIKAVLMQSLEEKIASLDEDGWMFGDEEKEEDA